MTSTMVKEMQILSKFSSNTYLTIINLTQILLLSVSERPSCLRRLIGCKKVACPIPGGDIIYNFILNFSLVPRSSQLGKVYSNEIKYAIYQE